MHLGFVCVCVCNHCVLTHLPIRKPCPRTNRCDASAKLAKVGVGVAEAKAAKTRVRTISMVAEVAAQAAVQAGAAAGRGRGKGDPKSPEPSGKHSSDEAEVPLAPVKEKPAVKDGNSKAKAKAKAKAKSKAKACPEAKSHPKSKAKAKAKAKSNGKRGLESPTEPTADEKPGNERAESVASPIRPRTLFTGSPAKPIFNTPARRDLGKGRGKGKKAANSKPVAPPRASDFLRDNQATLPNSFARRAIPAGVAALERYCRIVRAFQNQVECEIEPGTKCKTEVGISYLNKQR